MTEAGEKKTMMKLSVVIPAHNEQECIKKVVDDIITTLNKNSIPHEIILVDDNSTDMTAKIVDSIAAENSTIRAIHRTIPQGFGRAVKDGLENVTGDIIAIVMGDGSDDPEDIIKYYNKICSGYDCAFGSRFMKGTTVQDYPIFKLLLNRIANMIIKVLFLIEHNDITNAFKAYHRKVIEAVKPLISNHFNITIEIPLKAINRGFSYATVPINWYGRKSGVSKLKIAELQKKYLFTLLYCWLEKVLLKDEIRR